jgi:hypothetical protein
VTYVVGLLHNLGYFLALVSVAEGFRRVAA